MTKIFTISNTGLSKTHVDAGIFLNNICHGLFGVLLKSVTGAYSQEKTLHFSTL